MHLPESDRPSRDPLPVFPLGHDVHVQRHHRPVYDPRPQQHLQCAANVHLQVHLHLKKLELTISLYIVDQSEIHWIVHDDDI